MPNFKPVTLFFVAVLLGISAVLLPTLFQQKSNVAMKPIQPVTLTGEYDSTQTVGQFLDDLVASSPISPPAEQAQLPASGYVLGDTTATKRIEVDLATQHLYAFEGDNLVYDFVISSGKWGRTPTGTFKIWGKFRFTKMEGGNKALHTYYYLPNVPYVMFFSNSEVAASRGFSIHGTYWHNNFGTPMSHGCINMKTEEAGIIYAWAEPNIGDKPSGRATAETPGTEITIYGTPPPTVVK